MSANEGEQEQEEEGSDIDLSETLESMRKTKKLLQEANAAAGIENEEESSNLPNVNDNIALEAIRQQQLTAARTSKQDENINSENENSQEKLLKQMRINRQKKLTRNQEAAKAKAAAAAEEKRLERIERTKPTNPGGKVRFAAENNIREITPYTADENGSTFASPRTADAKMPKNAAPIIETAPLTAEEEEEE